MTEPEATPRSIDNELVSSIARWSVIVSALIVLFDIAIAWNYPFPLSSSLARGVFYGVGGTILIVAACGCAFFGYRIISMRVVRRTKRVYVIFLPLMAVASSIVWLYLLSPAT